MDVGRPTLDHLAVFLAIVEEGSFSAAARRLGRSVSVVSYAITTLEAQLGVTLFAREGSRRPELTEAGRTVVGHAKGISGEVDALVSGIRALNQGLEGELTFVVDVMIPQDRLAEILREFQSAFPTVDLRLHVESLGAVAELVVNGGAQIGLAGQVVSDHPDLHLRVLGEIELVPVAAPNHPLAQLAPIGPGVARRYRQLVLTDRSALTEGEDFAVFGSRSWRLGDLGAKHALLREGIGWGSMPHHMIARDLAKGRLVRLDIPEWRHTIYTLRAIWRRDAPPGPAGCWLIDMLSTAFAPIGAPAAIRPAPGPITAPGAQPGPGGHRTAVDLEAPAVASAGSTRGHRHDRSGTRV
ncbi:LysR family transcriptional regulator [Novosphingobium aerophilum]|uniref:LysR family transcriptional regulator n=1 Tax=Novosphingobium aerophilum TaxID=2839843 RepID=A0A7X1FAB6_9SPHN|nr:LysR family transcriptional regulator [Novosphingobium aerophilum]MBC2653318.1 LysR family transcriptional regulator [Novosphingobium aerophilum]